MQLMEHDALGGMLRKPAPTYGGLYLGGVVPPGSPNPDPISDQIIHRMFAIVYFFASHRLVPVFKALFMARP